MDASELRYRQLNDWDAAMMRLEKIFHFLSSPHQLVSHAGSQQKAPSQVSLPGMPILSQTQKPDGQNE